MASQSQQRRQHQAQRSNSTGSDSESGYECGICLSQARSPIVLACGHMFCWSCIGQWLSQSRVCPFCHSKIDPDKDVIPIYGKGSQEEPSLDRPRPRAPLQNQQRQSQRTETTEPPTESTDDDDFIGNMFKIGAAAIGGAILGAFIHSFASSSSSSSETGRRNNRRN